jgi:NAD(P)-dependent dehydrogenase (short-subunit alcohol dehydrogenase family)
MTKNALLWGADGGIGLAIARRLIADGWKVILVGRHLERLEGLDGVSLDFEAGNPFSYQTTLAAISQEVDEIQLWIYAVGDIAAAQISQMSLADWRRIMDANLTGAFLATQASWPILAKDAHLFYLGALHDRLRQLGLGAYAAAKAGLEAFADVVRKESRRRVTVVRPAAVNTPMWLKAPFKLPPRHLQPEEVAEKIMQAYQEGAEGNLDL